MQYIIEKDRPVPMRGKIAPVLRQLKPGDSVLFTDGQRSGACHGVARRLGIKIVTQKEKQGLRVWRIGDG